MGRSTVSGSHKLTKAATSTFSHATGKYQSPRSTNPQVHYSAKRSGARALLARVHSVNGDFAPRISTLRCLALERMVLDCGLPFFPQRAKPPQPRSARGLIAYVGLDKS